MSEQNSPDEIKNKILQFYKDPKLGLSITNTFRNLLKAGYKVTLSQIQNTIKEQDEYHKARKYTEQKHLFLKTVTGSLSAYQADVFFLKQNSKSMVKFVAIINVETRKGYVYHIKDKTAKSVKEVYGKFIQKVPANQYPTVISTDLGGEFNSDLIVKYLKEKNVRMFYINKKEYKTSYATAIVDRFIRTIKDKLKVYQKLNDSKSIINAVIDIVEGYNNSVHGSLGKSPNEMTYEDVKKNIIEKQEHNQYIINNFMDKAEGKTVGILQKKEIFDKGDKIKLLPQSRNIISQEGYNFKLDSGRMLPPKDLVILKNN